MNNYPMIGQTDFGNEIKETLNARDLHVFLQSKRQFADWIKTKLNKVGFREGIDYLLHKIVKQVSSGGKHLTEYYITTEAAKQIALMENTQVGYEYRAYLIDRDKKLSGIEHGQGSQVDFDEDWTPKIAMVREVRQSFGKGASRQMWAKLGLPIIEMPKATFEPRPNPWADTEAFSVFTSIIVNPPYVALTNKQLVFLIKDLCVSPPKEREISGVLRLADVAVRCIRLGKHKVVKVKLLVDDDLSNNAIKAAVRQFDADYGL